LGIDLTSRVGLGILSGSETKCPWLKQPIIVKKIPGKLIRLFKKYTVPSILKLKIKVVPEILHTSPNKMESVKGFLTRHPVLLSSFTQPINQLKDEKISRAQN
jgi:hypothetical protein